MSAAYAATRFVRKVLLEQLRPCFLVLDQAFRLLRAEGDPGYYGFDFPEVGADCREALPFLFGLFAGEAIHLPLVETPSGRAADVLLSPLGHQQGLLLTDASRERASRQAVQQQANEMRLLYKEQQQLLEELRRARDDLARRHQEALDVSRMKSRFIAGLSHEVRTPLTGILGHASLLHDCRRNADAIAENVQSIEANATHLLALVDNVLDQASLEVGQLTLHPVPTRMAGFCGEMQDMFGPAARKKGLEFRLYRRAGLPEWVEVDVTRLRQVVINLVGNGIKFTDSGFVALIIAWADDHLHVSVSDSGPGVPDAARAFIFLPFRRALDTTSKRGAGLGLAISAQLVQLMGGNLRLEERPGGGSIFAFSVRAPEIDLPSVSEESDDGNGRRVLMVDDSADIRTLYSRLLERAGFVVDTAADEPEAWQKFEARRPQVVLVDLYLKEWEGSGFIRRLRSRGFTGGVAAWSASALREDKQRAMGAGADAYLVKPVEPAVLSTSLNEIIRRGEPSSVPATA